MRIHIYSAMRIQIYELMFAPDLRIGNQIPNRALALRCGLIQLVPQLAYVYFCCIICWAPRSAKPDVLCFMLRYTDSEYTLQVKWPIGVGKCS